MMVIRDPLMVVNLRSTWGYSVLSMVIEELMEADDYGWVDVMIREDWVATTLGTGDVQRALYGVQMVSCIGPELYSTDDRLIIIRYELQGLS